jgi:formylglycine-generating enzyme required for sulfatase activity
MRLKILFIGVMALVAALSACDGDDVVIPPTPPATGTVIVSILPDTLSATRALAGPDGYAYTSAKNDTLHNLAPGTYTCTWSPHEGWIQPTPSTRTASLAAGDTVVFSGTYLEIIPIWDTWVTIPAGNFLMGASDIEETALRNEKPQHQVTLSNSFLMQATEVTNAQYLDMALWALDQGIVTTNEDGIWDNLDGSTDLLMDFTEQIVDVLWCEIEYDNGSLQLVDIGFGMNPNHPAKMMTWAGAAAYCDWKSLREGLVRTYDHSDWSCRDGVLYGAAGYRLPTEAEWEYACRAGTTTPLYSGDIINPLGDAGSNEPALDGVAWYPDNSVDWTHPVAELQPNDWGLYDMHGNLFKWVHGFEYYYTADAEADPTGSEPGNYRVIKGGTWTRPSHFHRSAYRHLIVASEVTYGSPKLGFRPVKTVP